jgi:ketosteroid isomerase-like protein
MSNPEQNVAVARDGIDAFQRGDVEAFLEFLDPEVELFSPPDLPNPTQSIGRDGYVEWVSRWLEAWESFEVDANDYEAVGRRHVLIDVTQRGIGKGSGIEVEMPAFYMIEIRDEQAARVHLYPDREKALAAAESGEAPAPAE